MSLKKLVKIAAVLIVTMTVIVTATKLCYKLRHIIDEDIALANIVGALSTSEWRSVESNPAMSSNG